ncbi:MAG: ABC transporter ATP-binding protein [Bacteroidota bacterium]|nr:ABC transporter ATP-binding protein [Bacteroidota bacterium]
MIGKIRRLSYFFTKILHILTDDQKRTYLTSLFFMFINSILELCTLGMFIPFIIVVLSPPLAQHYMLILPILHFKTSTELIFILAGVILGLFIIKNWVSYKVYSYYNRYAYAVATEISKKKLQYYYAIGFLEFQKSNSAELLREVTSVPIEFAHHILLGSLVIFSEVTILLLFTAGIAFFKFGMFLLLICTVLPFTIVVWSMSNRFLKETKKTIQQISPLSLHTLADAVSGYQEASLYNKEDFFVNRYYNQQSSLNIQLGKLNTANIIPARLSELFVIAGVILTLFFYLSIEGGSTTAVVSALTIFVTFIYRAIPSITKIMNSLVHMRTYSFTLDLIPSVHQIESLMPVHSIDAEKNTFQFEKNITLHGISFSYPEQKTPMLHNAHLSIHKGDFIGISGRSGLGKTTFIRILLQQVKQNSGTISLDGKPIGEYSIQQWRKLFSYVSQHPAILSDTIEANVAFGVLTSEIDRTKVQESLRRAGLGTFVDHLPDGINTIVGEQGKTLSGGQKQRLIIARALYRDAQIFIFDEATSELDKISEVEVLGSMKLLHKAGKTLIVISHQQHVLSSCSKVYSLKHGNLYKIKK